MKFNLFFLLTVSAFILLISISQIESKNKSSKKHKNSFLLKATSRVYSGLKFKKVNKVMKFLKCSSKNKLKSKLKSKNKSILVQFDDGSTKATLLKDNPGRFVTSPALSAVFTLNVKVDKLAKGGKVWIGVVSTNKIGPIKDDELVEEWYVSSVADAGEFNKITEESKIKEGDIVSIFGNSNQVGFKINNLEYRYDHKTEENQNLRFAVKLFNKGDSVSIINYTSTETEFKKNPELPTPIEMKNLMGKISKKEPGGEFIPIQ
jgi:hypothetical protein